MFLPNQMPGTRHERVSGPTWRGLRHEADELQRPTSRLAPEDAAYANSELARIQTHWEPGYNAQQAEFAERIAAVLAKQFSIDACLADPFNDVFNGTDVIAVVGSESHPSLRDENDTASSLVGIDITIGGRAIDKKLQKTLKRAVEIPHPSHRDYVYIPDDWKEGPDAESFKYRLSGGLRVSDRVFRVPTVGYLPFVTIKEPLTDNEAKDVQRLFALQLTLQCRDLGLLCANRLSKWIGAQPADIQTVRQLESWIQTFDWMGNPGQVRLGKVALGYLDGYAEFKKPLLSRANPDAAIYGKILQGSSLGPSAAWQTLIDRHHGTPLFALVTATLETAQTIEELCREEARATRAKAA